MARLLPIRLQLRTLNDCSQGFREQCLGRLMDFLRVMLFSPSVLPPKRLLLGAIVGELPLSLAVINVLCD